METIILCGGGTLGHVTPNIAIFNKLKKQYNFIYVGSKNGIEKKFVSEYMPYYEIETVKFIRGFKLQNLLIPIRLLKGIYDAKKIIKKTKPCLIVSKGGFVSVPVVFAANKLHITCITHESDFSLGLANKLIAKKCKYVCTSFEATSKSISNGVYTGSPVREQIFKGDRKKILDKYNLNQYHKNILIIGGSQGSEKINREIRNILPKLSEYNIIHLTGKDKIDKTINQPCYVQIEFANDIEDYFAFADIIITRGGSNTLFELLALKKPMLIIPLENSSRGDQLLNADDFVKNGYANSIRENKINQNTLYESIIKTINNASVYINNMSKKSKDGTNEICNIIKKIT